MKTPVSKRLMGVLTLALACAAGAGATPLNIVATTADIADLAKAVAGEHAVVSSICTGTEDPHYLTAKPGFIARLFRAAVSAGADESMDSTCSAPPASACREKPPV